jgi:PAS domain S-box-containing protein
MIARLCAFLDNLSLRKALAAALIVGLVAPTGISAWLFFMEQRALLLERLDNDHARIVTVLALGMQTPVWEIRPDAGKSLLDALMLDPRVTAISVSSPLVPRFLDVAAPRTRHGATLSRTSPVVHDGEIIGEVRVDMATDQLEAQLAARWSQILLTGVLQLVTGLLVIAALLRYKVMRPLQRLIDQAETLAVGTLDQALTWRRGDELGALGRSFEKMRQSLRDLFSHLEQRNRDLRQQEQEHQRWLCLFRDAIESIPNGFGVYDASGRLIICNAAFASLYGVAAKTLVGCTAAELYARLSRLWETIDGRPPQNPQEEPYIADANWLAAELEPAEGQLKDGRWFLISRHPTAEGGNVFVRTDITHLKQMEQALRESEQRFRSITEAHPVPVVIGALDKDRLLYASPGMGRLFGAPVTEIIDRSPQELFTDPGDRCKLRAMLLDRGSVDSYECVMKKADGSTFPVAITARRIDYVGTDAVVGGIIDLTEIRFAEREIARQREALHQSEKLNALGSLLAGVAHELNNPLSVVVGRSIMLEGQVVDPAIRTKVQKIRQAAERGARIVKTFLAIARQQPPERKPAALNRLIEAAVELMGYGLRTADIATMLELDPALPELSADADQLTQVFTNLIANAQQALLEVAPPRRLVIATRPDQAAGTVRIIFTDNGPGVPEALRSRIFEPFYTSKPVGVGTGIGLSFSYGVVVAHGGQIILESPGSGGARFVVTLPLPAMLPAPAPSAPLEQSGVEPRSILIVDDERDIAEMLAELLTSAGHRVDLTTSGNQALRRLALRSYDAILCDLKMPDLDGPGLYRRLQRSRPHLLERVIFISGDTLGMGASEFLAQTGRPLLEKPFIPGEVLYAVNQILNRGCPADSDLPARAN